jgi:hypothetical protein
MSSLGTRLDLPAAVVLCTFAIASACSSDRQLHSDGVPSDAGTSADAAARDASAPRLPSDPCPVDNPFCRDEPPGTPPPGCTAQKFDLRPAGVNVVVAVDGSKSMTPFWPQIRDAVADMMTKNKSIRFGADLFWADVVESVDEGLQRINACGDTQHKLLDLGLDQGAKLGDLFGTEPPGPGIFFWDFTPVADPLNYYLINQTALSDPQSTNYLVLISDGNDNCYGNFWAGEADKRLAYEKLSRELVKKNIRVLPVGFNAASDQINLDGSKVVSDFGALDTIAVHGGTGLDKALAADDPEQLAVAIEAVSQRIASCRFQIPAALDPTQNVNPFALEFLLNGMPVTRDRAEKQGWNFVQGNLSEVEFFGQSCQAVRAGVKLEAQKSCNATEVCGNAATKVSAKPRAVQYLLDRSASMGACTAGFLDCIPGITPSLTWWGVAARAISSSVTAPVNDDVEFGLKYFPNSNEFGCNVSDDPEIAPAPGTAIALIGNVLHNLPTGSTPLIAGLERVAANPGRLADPQVTGALIVVSDGGESCEAIEQPVKVQRLAVAARTLKAAGVRVFAVRFGAKGDDFADQDAQLRAIVREGGTATGDADDPNNVPYLEAPDADSLNLKLSTISEQLAACSLELGALDPKADKDQVNLYLNGDIVRFDSQTTKQDGWGWLDAAQTQIELYGPTCTAYKNSRTTSINIEVGCTPVILL